jgi:transcriptional regulator with XRE-family HTH domain
VPALDRERRNRQADFDDIVGDNLRIWREHLQISQADLAEAADMSQSQLCRVEKGERTLTLRQALAIKEALEISVDDLLDDD